MITLSAGNLNFDGNNSDKLLRKTSFVTRNTMTNCQVSTCFGSLVGKFESAETCCRHSNFEHVAECKLRKGCTVLKSDELCASCPSQADMQVQILSRSILFMNKNTLQQVSYLRDGIYKFRCQSCTDTIETTFSLSFFSLEPELSESEQFLSEKSPIKFCWNCGSPFTHQHFMVK